jgi:hypothetical protein
MTAPALAAPAMATPALAALALAALGVWATDEVSAIGLYGCTKQITTVTVGGLFYQARHGLQDQSAVCGLSKNPRPK